MSQLTGEGALEQSGYGMSGRVVAGVLATAAFVLPGGGSALAAEGAGHEQAPTFGDVPHAIGMPLSEATGGEAEAAVATSGPFSLGPIDVKLKTPKTVAPGQGFTETVTVTREHHARAPIIVKPAYGVKAQKGEVQPINNGTALRLTPFGLHSAATKTVFKLKAKAPLRPKECDENGQPGFTVMTYPAALSLVVRENVIREYPVASDSVQAVCSPNGVSTSVQ